MRDFTVVGHRGAMAHAPENSIESFLLAERSGADELELDIRLTGDGVPVVLHDATLARVAAAAGPLTDVPVAELSLAQLRTVTLRSGAPVLTFAEVLQVTSVTLQVEIKAIEAVPAVADILAARRQDAARCHLSSFRREALLAAKEHLPHVPRGLIVGRYADAAKHPGGLDATLVALGASRFYCGFEGLTGAEVERLHGLGYEVHAWPLRTLDDVCSALRLGVDGGTSDDPGAARRHLAEVQVAGAVVSGVAGSSSPTR